MAKETIIPKGYEIERLFFTLISESEAVRMKYKSYHSSLHRYLIWLCNTHYWKNPIGVHTADAMLYAGIGDPKVYKRAMQDLHDWGLIVWLHRSKNQFSCNKIHLCFEQVSETKKQKLAQEYLNALEFSPKQLQSNSKATPKQLQSNYGFSKQDKQFKQDKLSQTDEREISEILDSEEGNDTPLITPKNQGKEKGAGGGGDLKTDIIKYFVANNWSEALAVKYYDTYTATNWTHNGEKIKSWQAFAKGFIDKQPSQPQTTSTYRGIEPPPNFW